MVKCISGFPLSLILILTTACSQTTPIYWREETDFKLPSENYFKKVRQITHGGQNLLPNWSSDMNWIGFQNKGEGLFNPNPKCFQIYQMRADGAVAQRLSHGAGSATHVSFFPNGDRIVFSSTFATLPECPLDDQIRPGSTWAIYQSFQIYGLKLKEHDLIPLEPAAPRAYNSEISFCKDGSLVFTSNRDGNFNLYRSQLDSLGTMKEVQPIIQGPGYRGGASFSPDCKRIVWHFYKPKTKKEELRFKKKLKEEQLITPTSLEIWIANADGSEARALTKLNSKSSSPVFTPDGENILFASNSHNPNEPKFSLYLIDITGTKIERISRDSEFDAYPSFAGDGKSLAFSSKRNAKDPEEINIFVAKWEQLNQNKKENKP